MKAARPVLLAALAALGTCPAGAQATENIVSILERFDHLAVGEAVSVSEPAPDGPATRPASSSRAGRLRSGPGDEVVGIFFEGVRLVRLPVRRSDRGPGRRLRRAEGLEPQGGEDGRRHSPARHRSNGCSGSRAASRCRSCRAPPRRRWRMPSERSARSSAGCTRRRCRTTSRIQTLDAPEAPLVWAEIEGGTRGPPLRLRRHGRPVGGPRDAPLERVGRDGAAQVPLARPALAASRSAATRAIRRRPASS